MSQAFDASRSLHGLEQDSTIIAVIEISQAKRLVAGVVPGVERQPLKRLAADEAALVKLLAPSRTKPAGPGARSNAWSSVSGRTRWLWWSVAASVEAYTSPHNK